MSLKVLFGITTALSTDALVNPMRRVITLLQDMQKEVEAEGEKEKKLYDNFMCFCKQSEGNLSQGGQGAKGQIEHLSAQLDEQSAEKKGLSNELVQHKKDRADAEQDLAQATSIREREHEEFVAQTGDQKKNLDAMNAAIKSLEKGMGASAFLELPAAAVIKKMIQSSATIDTFDRQNVLSFLSQGGDYAPQGGQIVGILKNMKDEMDKSLGGAVQEEERAAGAYEDLKAAKNKEIAAASAAIEHKTKRAGELAVSIVQTKNALDDSGAELGDTQKFLANLAVQCKEKTEEWQERSSTRQQEIAAISEAISVLNDDDALDVFKSTLPSPQAQVGFVQRHLGFLQAGDSPASKLEKARVFISSASQIYRSQPLSLLSYTLNSKIKMALKKNGAGKVDFGIVVKMVDDMVTLLAKEQADDEKHKGWCEREFDRSGDESVATQEKIDSLSSDEQEIKDNIEVQKNEAATLRTEIKQLDQSVAEATAQRKQEHNEYTETVTMTEAAIQLIEKAKNRLNKFYNPNLYKAAPKRELTQEEKLYADAGHDEWNATPAPEMIAGTTQTVFLQIDVAPPVAPETFGAYQKKDGKSKGVIALMEMLKKDLEKDISEAEHNEKTAQKEYAQLTSDAQETRAQDAKSITEKEATKASLESRLQETKTQKVMSVDQLNQTNTYVADLHSSCDFIMQNFDLRKQARSNETESLKNAKAVLSGASYS